jgi:hypothetical protein
MIHLSLKSNVPDYHMTDDHQDLLSPVYMIRFRNRATHWRYVGKNFNTSSVTNEPLPLTRFGVITDVAVPDKNGVMLEDLPNPGNTMIRTDALTSADEKKYYSEIHIH